MSDQNVIRTPVRRPGPAPRSEATSIEISRAVAEVQAAVTVAQARPRDVTRTIEEMRISCGRMALAEHAFFSFKRAGNAITGPSIKLATELARCWGNMNYGVRELSRDEVRGMSEMLAFAWDLQANLRPDISFLVPHMRDKTGGPVALVDLRDIYENNANNAARRLREMIFRALPPWYVEEAKDLCHKTLQRGEGDVPLPQRIANLVQAFGKIGISRERIEARLGHPVDRMTVIDLANMAIVYKSLERGETTKEDEFPSVAAEAVERALAPPAQKAAAEPFPPGEPELHPHSHPPAKNWRPDTVGQEATTKAICDLAGTAEEESELAELGAANADRFKSYTRANVEKMNEAIRARRAALAKTTP